MALISRIRAFRDVTTNVAAKEIANELLNDWALRETFYHDGIEATPEALAAALHNYTGLQEPDVNEFVLQYYQRTNDEEARRYMRDNAIEE